MDRQPSGEVQDPPNDSDDSPGQMKSDISLSETEEEELLMAASMEELRKQQAEMINSGSKQLPQFKQMKDNIDRAYDEGVAEAKRDKIGAMALARKMRKKKQRDLQMNRQSLFIEDKKRKWSESCKSRRMYDNFCTGTNSGSSHSSGLHYEDPRPDDSASYNGGTQLLDDLGRTLLLNDYTYNGGTQLLD